MSSWIDRLGNMFCSMGRMLDFRGVYNSHLIEEILSKPGYVRDRENFERDGRALAGDFWKAYAVLGERLEPPPQQTDSTK